MPPQTTVLLWKLGSKNKSPQPLGLDQPVLDINSASKQLPGGAYTTLRTYEGKCVLRLEEHIFRLEESAKLRGIKLFLDRELLRAALAIAIHSPPAGDKRTDFRLRITLDLEREVGDVYLLREALVVPSDEDYRHGVAAVISPLRRHQPEAKLTSFLSETAMHPPPENTNEALLVDDQEYILEGQSSNFFAIINSDVWTAEKGILLGTTRGIIIDVIKDEGIALKLQAAQLGDIPRMSEAFISSTSRGVLPVVWIDSETIGSGFPGAITQLISMKFNERVKNELEPL